MRFESPKCVCDRGSALDPAGGVYLLAGFGGKGVGMEGGRKGRGRKEENGVKGGGEEWLLQFGERLLPLAEVDGRPL